MKHSGLGQRLRYSSHLCCPCSSPGPELPPSCPSLSWNRPPASIPFPPPSLHPSATQHSFYMLWWPLDRRQHQREGASLLSSTACSRDIANVLYDTLVMSVPGLAKVIYCSDLKSASHFNEQKWELRFDWWVSKKSVELVLHFYPVVYQNRQYTTVCGSVKHWRRPMRKLWF